VSDHLADQLAQYGNRLSIDARNLAIALDQQLVQPANLGEITVRFPGQVDVTTFTSPTELRACAPPCGSRARRAREATGVRDANWLD